MTTDELAAICQQHPGKNVYLEDPDHISSLAKFDVDTFDADEGEVLVLMTDDPDV